MHVRGPDQRRYNHREREQQHMDPGSSRSVFPSLNTKFVHFSLCSSRRGSCLSFLHHCATRESCSRGEKVFPQCVRVEPTLLGKEKSPERTSNTGQCLKVAMTNGNPLFSRAYRHSPRSYVLKQKASLFRLGVRKKFITMRVGRHWYRSTREVVVALALEVCKARLEGTWSNLG